MVAQASSNIQQSINTAAEQLANAFNNKKAANEALKELKKALKEKLEGESRFQELSKREKELKNARKDISEELKEIKKEKEQMAVETEEQQEIDEFIDEQDTKFGDEKDRVIAQLSRDLADNGMIAEIHYKNGQLILIVARS